MFPQSLSLSQTVLPLPSVSRLSLNFTSMTRNTERLIIDSLGTSFFSEWRDVNEIESHPLEVILGVDAASVPSDAYIPHVEGRLCNNAHLFYVMPLNPVFPSFCVLLRFVTTGSLGEKSSIICDEICGLLRDSLICVRSIVTDGDRAPLPCHNSIFALYKNCLDDNILTTASRVSDRVWEFTDPLHLVKCQRCRLRYSSAFTRFSEKLDSMGLNFVLEGGKPLAQFGGVNAMNDPDAVLLLSMENLLWLLLENNPADFFYFLPLCVRYQTLSNAHLAFQCRPFLVEFLFPMLMPRYRVVKSNTSHTVWRIHSI
jgi:hypothetical protein